MTVSDAEARHEPFGEGTARYSDGSEPMYKPCFAAGALRHQFRSKSRGAADDPDFARL